MSLNNAIRRGSNPSSNGLPQPPLQSSKLPSDTSKLLDKENSRKLITSIDFDPSIFLEQQINTISIDSGDPEQKLYNLFDSLTNQLTIISNDIELEANILQDASDNMENILYDELDDHSIQLNSIHTAIDQVKLNFNNASDNAIKIGSRLQNSEKERLNIVKSLELLSYIKDFYNLPNDITDTILSLNAIKLKEKILPNTLKTKEWNDISKVLHDLKKITMDITSTDEILKITKVIGNISEVVENELLGQFEIILEQIMESNSNMIYGTTQYPNGSIHNMSMIMNNNNHFFDHSNSFVMVDELLLEKARHLTECLHLFNNGQSLQKRYIFSVIQKRIPNNVYNSANANGKAGGGGVLHRLNNVFNQNSDDEMSSAGASSDGSDSEEDGARPARRRNNNNNGQYDDDNILQKATQATQNTINLLVNGLNTSYHNNSNNGELQVGDQLSNLFSIIDKVCREQFEIIRKIFPANTIARVTRLLVQRIFGDPAFGIQTKVDSILCPPSPLPPLALSDYLDALLTVREKLSALHLLLIECSLDPSLIGMGSESESLRKSKNEGWILMKIKNNSKNGGEGKRRGDSGVGGSITGVGGDDVDSKVLGGGGGSGNSYVGSGTYTHEESEEKIRSDAEIKEFLEEQITQVLSGYMNDYFEKEIHYVRSQYVNTMRVLVEETTTNTKVNAGTLLTLPQIKAEKLKTILNINKTIGNKGFFNTIFNITIDALLRMESIGRDDNKRLYLYCKNLYQLLLSFLTDGVILPICKTCTTLLIKQASCKPNESSLPPNEFLTILIVILYVKNKLKLLFDDHFYKIMKITPNYITICKENRLKSFQTIVYVLKESLHAWTLCISLHIEKLFLTLQGKFDYSTSSSLSLSKNNLMKQDALAMLQRGLNGFNGESNHNSLPCTAACNSVCKALILISQAVRNVENELQQQQQQSSNGAGGNSSGGNNSLGLDFEEVFWKPLGQQFVGAIISNIRRYKITIDGARVLLKDLEEFHSLTGLMTCIETMDMIVCLIEICKVFTADAEDVVKIVVEDLRHLDVAIVLSLVQCRADFIPRTNGSWAKVLSTSFSNYKWETPLPWETKKPLTIVSFSETLADNTNARPLGPKTLRREATTLSALYLSELALNRQSSHLSLPGDGRVSIDQKNRVVSLDLSLLEENLSNTDLQKHIKAVELHEAKKSQISSSKVHSKFLPNRPGDEESNNNHMVLPASSKGGSQKRPSETGVIAASIQRPDLIGLRTDSGERTKSTSSIISGLSNGSANGDSRGSLSGPSNGKRKSITEAANGTNGGQQPRQSVTESPATATLSATMKGNATPSPNGVRPTGMLSKMSSFFTGKK